MPPIQSYKWGMDRAQGTVALALLASCVLPHGPAAAADTDTSVKTITWTTDAVPAAGAVGSYSWGLGANATALGSPTDNESNPVSGGLGSATFDATAPLAPVTQSTTVATSGGATAQTSATFATAAPVVLPTGLAQLVGSFSISGTVNTPVNSQAAATGDIGMTLTSGIVSGSTITESGKSVQITPDFSLNPSATPGASAVTASFDPVNLLVLNSFGGQVIFSELEQLTAQQSGAGSLKWDSSGLVLTAPADGTSSVALSLYGDGGTSPFGTSPLVTNDPPTGSVGIFNGQFNGIGTLASLPWQVNSTATTTEAFLPAGVLDSLTYDYQIPSDMVYPDGQYYEQLQVENDGQAINETNGTAPEPASLSLIPTLGLLTLHKRPRRCISSHDCAHRQPPHRLRLAAPAGRGCAGPSSH